MTRKITVTIPVEVRTRETREVKVKMWIGTGWKYLDWTPFSPALAARTRTTSHSYKTVLHFTSPGIPSIDSIRYESGLLKSMRQMGVIR